MGKAYIKTMEKPTGKERKKYMEQAITAAQKSLPGVPREQIGKRILALEKALQGIDDPSDPMQALFIQVKTNQIMNTNID